MTTPSLHLLTLTSGHDRELFTKQMAVDSSGVNYLACCYARACLERGHENSEVLQNLVADCQKKIVQMAMYISYVFNQPGFFVCLCV